MGEQKRIGVYVRSGIVQNETQVTIKTANDAISILDSSIALTPHKKRTDMFLGYFRVRGEVVQDAVIIEAILNQNKTASAVAQVVETRIEEHVFAEPLEFEHKTYQVKEGSTRALQLFAKCPEVISEETKVDVISTDSEAVPIRGRCVLNPVVGSNHAVADVIVQGRRLNTRVEIKTQVKGYSASTVVIVRQRTEESGIPLRIELRNEDYGNFRARWAEHEGKPNLLLISARHKSLSRYLGPHPDFDGQNTPHFKILLAEIVTESVCRKSLVLEAQEHSWEFHWADEREDRIIAESVLSELHKRMREFALIAHSVMLENKEITAIT